MERYGIRSVRELLGHKDVRTSIIYTHMNGSSRTAAAECATVRCP
jgi:site-specific recombinase XerD